VVHFVVAVPASGQQGSAEAERVLSSSPMMQVEGFFMALTNSNTDGRVVVHRRGTSDVMLGVWPVKKTIAMLSIRMFSSKTWNLVGDDC